MSGVCSHQPLNYKIIKGKVMTKIGEIHRSNEGYDFEIVSYNSYTNVVVKLLNTDYEYLKSVRYGDLKKGQVKNPFHKSVRGVGYMGVGSYGAKVNGKQDIRYKTWTSMLNRCYKNGGINSYKDCTVCEEWHNYQNFAKWYDENYYEVDNEQMCLDKDILVKGNKVYSPETCIFVPERINYLFVKSKSSRGKLPIGVCKNGNKYVSFLLGYEKVKNGYLGMFNTVEEAFCVYKKTKEQYIKQVANDYKDKIPTKLYESMINYEVEITD